MGGGGRRGGGGGGELKFSEYVLMVLCATPSDGRCSLQVENNTQL